MSEDLNNIPRVVPAPRTMPECGYGFIPRLSTRNSGLPDEKKLDSLRAVANVRGRNVAMSARANNRERIPTPTSHRWDPTQGTQPTVACNVCLCLVVFLRYPSHHEVMRSSPTPKSPPDDTTGRSHAKSRNRPLVDSDIS